MNLAAPTAGRAFRRPPRLPDPVTAGTVAVGVHGLDVDRSGAAVLRGVDLEVRYGEVVALVGPNGAGKSTLLAAVCGDLDLAAGTVEVAGRPLHGWSGTELALRRAVLLQDYELSFPFTVRDTVAMGRTPWTGTPGAAEDDERVEAAMRAVDVDGLADRAVTRVSGGERARAAFARVLAQDAAILLLDEPTAALDIHHQELLLGIARERAAEGTAVVVVLHDLTLAAAYADRVALLAGGRVAAVGEPGEVLQPALLSSVYGHEVEVIRHPRTGELLVVPVR